MSRQFETKNKNEQIACFLIYFQTCIKNLIFRKKIPRTGFEPVT